MHRREAQLLTSAGAVRAPSTERQRTAAGTAHESTRDYAGMHTGTDLIREYELVRTRPGTVYSVIGHKARAGDAVKHASNEMPLHMRDLIYMRRARQMTHRYKAHARTHVNARSLPFAHQMPRACQCYGLGGMRRCICPYTRGTRHKAALIQI